MSGRNPFEGQESAKLKRVVSSETDRPSMAIGGYFVLFFVAWNGGFPRFDEVTRYVENVALETTHHEVLRPTYRPRNEHLYADRIWLRFEKAVFQKVRSDSSFAF